MFDGELEAPSARTLAIARLPAWLVLSRHAVTPNAAATLAARPASRTSAAPSAVDHPIMMLRIVMAPDVGNSIALTARTRLDQEFEKMEVEVSVRISHITTRESKAEKFKEPKCDKGENGLQGAR